jgi:hypothetical protein
MAEPHRPHAADTAHASSSNATVHHEESDVDIRAIVGFGAALVVAAVLIHLLTYVLFRYFESREGRRVTPEYPLAAAQPNRVPPEPRLQTDPREDLREMREQEDAVLESYGWVDKNAGVVRIPIDEAIKLTLERGLPARPVNEKKE